MFVVNFFLLNFKFNFIIENPWLCDNRLEWFRQLLRDNLDIDIDKPDCVAACGLSSSNCPSQGTPLKAADYCPISDNEPLVFASTALSFVGWIILGLIYLNN